MKKVTTLLLTILLALPLTACGTLYPGAHVLPQDEVLSIINETTAGQGMTFEVMEDFPTEPLPILLSFITDHPREQPTTMTEYYGDLIISTDRKYMAPNPNDDTYAFICKEQKTLILFGHYFMLPLPDDNTVKLDNTETESILLPEMEVGTDRIEIPLENRVDRSTLPPDVWHVYIVHHETVAAGEAELARRFRTQLEFLLLE